jgi:hypothetical protein
VQSDFRAGEDSRPAAIGETSHVIGMKMRQENRVDLRRLDRKGGQIIQEASTGAGHLVPATSIYERDATLRMDDKRVDAGPARRSKYCRQDSVSSLDIHVPHDVQVAVEVSITNGRDNDVANLAMIDTRDLNGGDGLHCRFLETLTAGTDLPNRS